MSKKFIALVLFAAMLLSLVPTAAAQTSVNYYDEYPVVSFDDDGWYVGQNVEKTIPDFARDKGFEIGVRKDGYGNDVGGVEVTIGSEKKTAAGAPYTTITVKGSYSKLQPYYYTHLAQYGNMGVAIKIPTYIATQAGEKVSESAYIAGAQGYLNTYPGVSTLDNIAYITVNLTPADRTDTFKIWYGNSKQYTVNVEWKNTDNVVATAKDTTVPTLTVVGVAGDQKENFRANFTQAYWKKNADDANKWYYYPGVLQFDIAAMTRNDRGTIFAKASNNMTIKVKALDKVGNPYPQGTIVTFDVADQNMYLGSSDKFVTVKGEASYLVDNMGCFTMTFDGIKQFAAAAAFGMDFTQHVQTPLGTNYPTAEAWKAVDLYDNVYLYTLTSNGLTKGTLKDEIAANSYKEAIGGSFIVRFAYGNTAEELGFNLKYQNVARTKSGITLLSDVITVKVGEQVGMQYIVDNPMAMYQDLKETWKIVNTGIADFVANSTDTDPADNLDNVIKGKKVGTTYAYCKDQMDEIELVIINVVPADYVETPVVEEVEVGTKYVVTASKLNVREGASTSFDRIRQITRNTVVTGTEVEGSVWVKLNDGGYVHGKYLAEVE